MDRLRALLLVAALAAPGCADRGPDRILLVVVDTLRRDHLSVYGSPVPTPNVAKLAARGQVFENVVASFHQTSMSMASMFTGRTPSIESGDPRVPLPWNGSTWCGLARFAREGVDEACIPAALPTLAERLSEAGYWTIGVVSNQFLYRPAGFSRGFAEWVEIDERKPVAGPASRQGVANPRRSRSWQKVNRAALAALDRAPRERVFLYIHYIDVHDYRFHKRSYAGSVQIQDRSIGVLFEGLERRSFFEDGVVVLTSDHGERLGEDHRIPGDAANNFGHYGNPSFEDTSRFLRTQDVFDLVLEIAGLAPQAADDTRPDELFVGELFFRTYRQGRFKTTVRRKDGAVFLYDLEADPKEQRNLAAERPARVRAHLARLDELTGALDASRAPQSELSDEDRERLRALGYLDAGEG